MKAVFDLSSFNNDATNLDIRRVCGPRFNTFNSERRDEAGKFFERAVWKSMTKSSSPGDEDSERWDGME
jgi:hypothetical protein